MKDIDIPPGFPIAFAKNAAGANITFPIPTAPQGGGRASLTDGFEPINFQPIQAGGIPPWGADVNGALRMVSAWAQWKEAGAPVFYDAAFSTAIGGYPNGAMLKSSTVAGKFWISKVDDNTDNPDTTPANWSALYTNSATPPAGTMSGVLGSAAGANKLASWTATQVVGYDAIGGRSILGSNLTLSFNGATTGAGGMVSGAMPTAADLFIYAIYNPTTNAWNTLGSASSSGPVFSGSLPAGFTQSCLIWAGKTTGGNFVAFIQQERLVQIAPNTLTSVVLPTSYGSATSSIAAALPANAKTFSIYFSIGSNQNVFLASSAAGIGESQTGTGGGSAILQFLNFPCVGLSVFWKATANITVIPTIGGYSI